MRERQEAETDLSREVVSDDVSTTVHTTTETDTSKRRGMDSLVVRHVLPVRVDDERVGNS